MKSLSIRNLSDDTYAHLQFLAKANRRSLQEQVKLLLEQEVALIKGSSLARADLWRQRLNARAPGDTVASIREDRDR
jgi:plasmid stability protein